MKKLHRLVVVMAVVLGVSAPAAAHNKIAPFAPAIDLRNEIAAPVQTLPMFAGTNAFDEVAHVDLPSTSIADQLARRFAGVDVESRSKLAIFSPTANRKLALGPLAVFGESNVNGESELGRELHLGLNYVRNRWFDPGTGTWLSPDPLGYTDSSNLYAFAGGDPVNGRDPLGEQVARPASRPAPRQVVHPPPPGQRGPAIRAPRTPTPYAPGDWGAFRNAAEAAKASRPKGAGARAFRGRTADELSPAEQIDFIKHRNRLRDDAVYREWWNTPTDIQLGSIVPGSTPDMPIESLPAMGGAGGGDDGGDDGVCWNNGWRTTDGKFASPCGSGQSGREAEEAVWDAVAQKPGWRVIRGRVYVRDPDGAVRVYDGVAISPRGRAIGLEVKSNSATRTASQRTFDQWLNSNPSNTATAVGQNRKLPPVERAVVIRRTTP